MKEVSEGIKIIKKYGSGKFAILKCTSNYPASFDDLNLETIRDLKKDLSVKLVFLTIRWGMWEVFLLQLVEQILLKNIFH